VERPKLVGATVPELLEQLDSPETATRLHAKRALKELGSETVLPELQAWVKSLDANDEPRLLEAMWLYQGFDVAAPQVLEKLLTSPLHEMRAAAVRQIPHWKDRPGMEQALEWLATAVADPHPRVRLEAVCALRAWPTAESAEIALRAADLPLDTFSEYALWQTARELSPYWLPELRAGKLTFDNKVNRLLFAVRAAEAPDTAPILVTWLKEGRATAEQEPQLLNAIGTLGGPDELRLVFDLAVDEQAAPDRAVDLLLALLDAKRRRNVQPAGDLVGLKGLFQSKTPRLQSLAATATGLWKIEALRADVERVAGNQELPAEIRIPAIQGLAQLGGVQAISHLSRLAAEAGDKLEPIRARAISELIPLDIEAAANLAVAWWATAKDVELQSTVFQAFLQQKGSADVLAVALTDKKLPPDAAKIGLRAISGSGRPEQKLSDALLAAGGITGGVKMLSPEEMQRLVELVKETGDPAGGEAIFRRHDLNCLKCHAIGGAGGKVGPDLISLGASAQVDYLLDSLLNPNAKVKENYNSLVVVTDAGKVISGIKVRESKTELVLRDTEDNEVVVPLASIEEQSNGTSLMPAGLTDRITETELVDLVRFLSELGKVGPYAISPTPVARKWDALLPNDQSYHRLTRTGDTPLMADDTGLTWVPAYSTVSGSLPIAELPTFTQTFSTATEKRTASFVRCRVQANSAGQAKLKIEDVSGLQLWINGTPRKVAELVDLDIPPGVLTISLSIDHAKRKTPLRLELVDSPPGVQFVTGK